MGNMQSYENTRSVGKKSLLWGRRLTMLLGGAYLLAEAGCSGRVASKGDAPTPPLEDAAAPGNVDGAASPDRGRAEDSGGRATDGTVDTGRDVTDASVDAPDVEPSDGGADAAHVDAGDDVQDAKEEPEAAPIPVVPCRLPAQTDEPWPPSEPADPDLLMLLAPAAGQAKLVIFDIAKGERVGEVPVGWEQGGWVTGPRGASVAWVDSGEEEVPGRLVSLPKDGGAPTAFPVDSRGSVKPVWSPRGDVALLLTTGEDGKKGVYYARAGTKEPPRLLGPEVTEGAAPRLGMFVGDSLYLTTDSGLFRVEGEPAAGSGRRVASWSSESPSDFSSVDPVCDGTWAVLSAPSEGLLSVALDGSGTYRAATQRYYDGPHPTLGLLLMGNMPRKRCRGSTCLAWNYEVLRLPTLESLWTVSGHGGLRPTWIGGGPVLVHKASRVTASQLEWSLVSPPSNATGDPWDNGSKPKIVSEFALSKNGRWAALGDNTVMAIAAVKRPAPGDAGAPPIQLEPAGEIALPACGASYCGATVAFLENGDVVVVQARGETLYATAANGWAGTVLPLAGPGGGLVVSHTGRGIAYQQEDGSACWVAYTVARGLVRGCAARDKLSDSTGALEILGWLGPERVGG